MADHLDDVKYIHIYKIIFKSLFFLKIKKSTSELNTQAWLHNDWYPCVGCFKKKHNNCATASHLWEDRAAECDSWRLWLHTKCLLGLSHFWFFCLIFIILVCQLKYVATTKIRWRQAMLLFDFRVYTPGKNQFKCYYIRF